SNRKLSHIYSCSSISSITKTIKTKNLIIDAINGLTIIKKDYDDDNERNDSKNSNEKNHQNNIPVTSTSPLRFGFFTPPSSSPDTIEEESNTIECQTLATITTISTSNNNNTNCEYFD
ncbi:unnamed protein product, partial [Rotaria socialis]